MTLIVPIFADKKVKRLVVVRLMLKLLKTLAWKSWLSA